jgi:protein-tyrosine phosphatase
MDSTGVAPLTTMPLARSVALTGVFNFRDLGGYRTRDGRTVRWHTLFRADGLDRLTSGDVEVLRPYGLRTVVDLRMAHELEDKGRFPVDTYPVTFHHLSVMDKTWDREAAAREDLPVADFLHARYTEMLGEAGPRYADALRLLAAPDALPAVFHCAAGKDRTGLLAMLVLGTLGVSHDDIVEDYALTSASMDAFRAHAATDPRVAEGLANTPVMFFAADPAAMSRVLGDIEAAHGSVRSYVRSIGVDEDVVAALEANLLTD